MGETTAVLLAAFIGGFAGVAGAIVVVIGQLRLEKKKWWREKRLENLVKTISVCNAIGHDFGKLAVLLRNEKNHTRCIEVYERIREQYTEFTFLINSMLILFDYKKNTLIQEMSRSVTDEVLAPTKFNEQSVKEARAMGRRFFNFMSFLVKIANKDFAGEKLTEAEILGIKDHFAELVEREAENLYGGDLPD